MKLLSLFPLVTALLAGTAVPLIHAQQPAPPAQPAANPNLPASFQADLLVEKDGRTVPMRKMFLFKLEAGQIVYADNEQGARFDKLSPASIKFMALTLPEDLTTAIEAYESGKLAEALPLLEKAINRYQPLRAIEGSPVARMEILRMDTLRRLKKFPELRDALAVAKPENYDDVGKDYLITLPAWDAHANRDWKRIEAISRDIDKMAPGTPAAELAFLRGEALGKLDRKSEALAEYHRAMAMDFTRSRDIFADAALGALALYNEDPLVKDYFDRFGTGDYNPEAAYVIPTKEAAFLANLINTMKPAGRTLPSSMKKFVDAHENFQKAKSDADKQPAPAQ